MFWIFLTVLVPAIASLFGTEAVRRYALRTSMIDVPNDRSSHTIPTPRGGGIAIAFSVIATLALLTAVLQNQRMTAIGILGGGSLIALIGLLDDRFSLSAKSRLIVHFLAASWFLGCIGIGDIAINGIELAGAWKFLAMATVVVFLVWCTNLYNFMDGLDGFAGGQAVVASLAAALICFIREDALLTYLMLATAGAAAGFLVLNWPPAKIFMGDCGSGFLGFVFGATVFAGFRHGSIPLSAGLMLIIVFLSDSTLTLLRRVAAGESWYRPHRTHAYQLATQLGASHRQVTVAALVAFVIAGTLSLCIAVRTDIAATLFVGYAIVIFAVWLLINTLIVGRRNVLASITNAADQRSADRSATLAVVNELSNASVAEPATALYLRLRKFQSRMLSGSSNMPKKDLLREVTGVASELGYNVSHDWLDGCGGGRCEVAGEKWILLDFNMSKQDQIKQIILAIHGEMDRAEAMSDELRTAFARTAGMPTPSSLPLATAEEDVRRAA